MRSVQTARRIHKLAADIGIEQTFVVANKIRQRRESDLLEQALSEQNIIGTIPFSAELARADLEGRSVDVEDQAFAEAVGRIGEALENELDGQRAAAQ